MLYMLIDITDVETTCIARVAELRQIIELSKLQKVAGRTVIGPAIEGKSFAKLEKEQLQYLVWNHTKTPPPEDYGELVQAALAIAQAIAPDETSLTDLEKMVKQSGYNDCSVAATPEEMKEQTKPREKKPRVEKQGADARPRSGTATGAVWDIADEMRAANGGQMPDRKAVIDKCVEDGINKATASTQFGKWKKAQGSN